MRFLTALVCAASSRLLCLPLSFSPLSSSRTIPGSIPSLMLSLEPQTLLVSLEMSFVQNAYFN